MSDEPLTLSDEAMPIPVALGPGDDDPRSPGSQVSVAQPALGPGDAVGEDPNAGYVVLVAPAPGPGDTPIQRTIVRIPQLARPADE